MPIHSSVKNRAQLPRLTSLRAFAALGVFAFHLGRSHLWGGGRFGAGGYVAVSFFFVLSGFILVWSNPAPVARSRFYRRRFARIYPAHLVTLIITLLVPVVASGRGALAVLLGVVLLQGWSTSSGVVFGCNDVSWSLSCEAFFYALFPIVLPAMLRASRRKLLRWVTALYAGAAILVIAGVVVSQVSGQASWNNLVYTDPLIRLPEFLLGMAAGIAFADGWRPQIKLASAVATFLVFYVVLCLVQAPGPMLDAFSPLVFVAIVVAAASADVAGVKSWLSHPWLVYAGEVSFCFYLVHEIVIVNVRQIAGGGLGTLVSLLGSAGAAVALHHFVELPLQRRLRPRARPRGGSGRSSSGLPPEAAESPALSGAF